MEQGLLSKILAFVASDKKTFIIKGKAGTGKTEIIKDATKYLSRHGYGVQVAAPTNKAASVLRKRGIEAITLHKALYKCCKKLDPVTGLALTKTVNKAIFDPHNKKQPLMDSSGNILYEAVEEDVWVFDFDQSQLVNHIELLKPLIKEFEHPLTGELVKIKPRKDDPKLLKMLGSKVVLIVDESSMITSDMWRNLIENTDFKIIAVGDTNQLEPVDTEVDDLQNAINYYDANDYNEFTLAELNQKLIAAQLIKAKYGNYFVDSSADWVCSTNHRTKSLNIVSLFESVLNERFARYPTPFEHKEVVVRSRRELVDKHIDDILCFADITIAWKNATVQELNDRIRRLKRPDIIHKVGAKPIFHPGEPLYVRSTYKCETGDITKGETISIITPISEYEKRIDVERGLLYVDVRVDATDDTFENVPLSLLVLGYQNHKKREKPKVDRCYVDLGYAITCHKAQGSQWDFVLVWDECAQKNIYQVRSWRYTAVTRAENYLAVLV